MDKIYTTTTTTKIFFYVGKKGKIFYFYFFNSSLLGGKNSKEGKNNGIFGHFRQFCVRKCKNFHEKMKTKCATFKFNEPKI